MGQGHFSKAAAPSRSAREPLAEYNRKRNFGVTSEPPGEAPAKPRVDGALSFVIQKHAASRLHYDFRLELNGVLLELVRPQGAEPRPQ